MFVKITPDSRKLHVLYQYLNAERSDGPNLNPSQIIENRRDLHASFYDTTGHT